MEGVGQGRGGWCAAAKAGVEDLRVTQGRDHQYFHAFSFILILIFKLFLHFHIKDLLLENMFHFLEVPRLH